MKAPPRCNEIAFDFTAADHLWVQRCIEARARELWIAAGCRDGAALDDWLAAEKEALEAFCQRRKRLVEWADCRAPPAIQTAGPSAAPCELSGRPNQKSRDALTLAASTGLPLNFSIMDTNQQSPAGPTRRQFIKKSTLAAAAVAASGGIFKTPVYGQDQAPSANVAGANNRLVVGYIGVGVQGMAHIGTQKAGAAANNIVQSAVCDLSTYRTNAARDAVGAGCRTFKNFDELLSQKDIDAVTIATPDHWHCRAAMAALDAGKHVYLEKPPTRYLGEAFQLADKVKSSGKVLQVGSQGCTAAAWHKAADLIRNGDIGPVVWAQGYYCRNNPKGEWNTEPYVPKPWCTPDDLDWAKWQEPVHDKRDFDPDSYFRWRKYYPYCAGLLGDLVPHRLLPLMVATGNPEFPVRVSCIGNKPVHTDRNTPNTRERDCPEHIELLAEFPSGLTMLIVSSSVAARSPGFVIYGHHATLEIGTSGERIDLKPEKEFADEVDMQTFDGLTPSEDIGEHEKNWFDCIRSNKTPNANIDLAVRAQAVLSLAEMSNRLNMTCRYDESTHTIIAADGTKVDALTYGAVEPS